MANRTKILLGVLLGLGATLSHAQLAHRSPYSNSVWPAQTFTASGRTGATIQLNGLTSTSTVGSSFATGTIAVSGTSLTSVTFAVLGSADNGVNFFPLPITPVATPCSTPSTTATATANALYQISLAGITHVRLATSGTFTATNVSFLLTATPNDSDSDISCGSTPTPPATPSYTFASYTYANNGGTSATTATTPAVTLAAGDFVFMMCQGEGVTLAGSSSPSNSWHSLTYTNGAQSGQGFYISSANAGSTTFTCTAGSAGPYLEAVAMIYHTSGGASGTVISGTDISSASICGAGLSCTSASFSTAVPSLVILCGQVNGNANWTAGLIGGTTATLRAGAGTGFTSTNPVCEDAQFMSAQTGITSSITQSNAGLSWNVVGAAFQ